MKTLKPLIGLFLVVAFFYCAWKMIPPYFNEYQFEDAITQISRYAAYNQQRTEQDIKDEVARKAAENDIPLTSEQIKVVRNGPELTISGDYTIHVQLPGYAVDLQFHPTSTGKRI